MFAEFEMFSRFVLIVIALMALITAMFALFFSGLRNVPRNVRRLSRLRGEEGFAYSVTMVLTLPFVTLVFLGVVEMTALMLSMIGVRHATAEAARASMARSMPEAAGSSEDRIRQAAIQALVPFAPGRYSKSMNANSSGISSRAHDYVSRYERYSRNGPIAERYLVSKFAYATRMTSADSKPPTGEGASGGVRVRFEHAFLSGFYGVLMGKRSERLRGAFVCVLEASATIPETSSASRQIVMEIDYDPNH